MKGVPDGIPPCDDDITRHLMESCLLIITPSYWVSYISAVGVSEYLAKALTENFKFDSMIPVRFDPEYLILCLNALDPMLEFREGKVPKATDSIIGS